MIKLTLKCKDYESACALADMLTVQGYYSAVLCEYPKKYSVIIKEVKKND